MDPAEGWGGVGDRYIIKTLGKLDKVPERVGEHGIQNTSGGIAPG